MIFFPDRFLKTHLQRMNFNQKFFFHLWMCTSWLTARLEISTSMILFSISILCVSLRSEISPVALGLALTYGLQLNALFQRVVQVSIDIMSYMISTERVLEYCEIESEPSTVIPFDEQIESKIVQRNTSSGTVILSHSTSHPSLPSGKLSSYKVEASKHTSATLTATDLATDTATHADTATVKDAVTATCKPTNTATNTPSVTPSVTTTAIIPGPDWPSQGIIRFENVWMQYRDNPAVLRGISFSTLPAMRIGTYVRTKVTSYPMNRSQK